MERAVVLSQGIHFLPHDLPFEIQEQEQQQGSKLIFALGTQLKDIERIVIQETLKRVDGDKNRAAEILGITARTIYRREAEWKGSEE
jgi:DNA-binding NtrC family response regulator